MSKILFMIFMYFLIKSLLVMLFFYIASIYLNYAVECEAEIKKISSEVVAPLDSRKNLDEYIYYLDEVYTKYDCTGPTSVGNSLLKFKKNVEKHCFIFAADADLDAKSVNFIKAHLLITESLNMCIVSELSNKFISEEGSLLIHDINLLKEVSKDFYDKDSDLKLFDDYTILFCKIIKERLNRIDIKSNAPKN